MQADRLRVVMAQVNPLVGDMPGNAQLIIRAAERAMAECAPDLVVFPELTLTAYPPEDLLLRPSLDLRVAAALEQIRGQNLATAMVVGYPGREQGRLFNMLAVIHRGRVLATYRKQRLPNYQVFDEKRYFAAGDSPCVIPIKGLPIGFTICEDLWETGPMEQAAQAGARLMININASPFHLGKQEERQAILQKRIEEAPMPIIYVNQVGGQDELVFDGGSMALDAKGELRALAPACRESLSVVDITCPQWDTHSGHSGDTHSQQSPAMGHPPGHGTPTQNHGTPTQNHGTPTQNHHPAMGHPPGNGTPTRQWDTHSALELTGYESPQNGQKSPAGGSNADSVLKPMPAAMLNAAPSKEALVYDVLTLGVRDYVVKNGFKGVVLGLSGGIDSALTLAIAVDALGRDKVRAVMMPYQYTADMSMADAAAEAAKLGVDYRVIPIAPIYDACMDSLKEEFAGAAPDVAEQNIQARCRGILLMATSNKQGLLVLTTGNKSEMAVGYSTLYGDMAGGFDVLKDVPKTLVYDLARYRNEGYEGYGKPAREVIPRRVLERPPSAELAPGQVDEDNLPPYEILDAILELYIEEDLSAHAIMERGFAAETVRRVLQLVDANEYKRRQAPVGIRISRRAFGRDRRYPITSGWKPGD